MLTYIIYYMTVINIFKFIVDYEINYMHYRTYGRCQKVFDRRQLIIWT